MGSENPDPESNNGDVAISQNGGTLLGSVA